MKQAKFKNSVKPHSSDHSFLQFNFDMSRILVVSFALSGLFVIMWGCSNVDSAEKVDYNAAVREIQNKTYYFKSKYESIDNSRISRDTSEVDQAEILRTSIHSTEKMLDSLLLIIGDKSFSGFNSELGRSEKVGHYIDSLCERISSISLSAIQNKGCYKLLQKSIDSILSNGELSLAEILRIGDSKTVSLVFWSYKQVLYEIGYYALSPDCNN